MKHMPAAATRSKSRLRARVYLLLTLAFVFLIVAFLFPLVFGLQIEVPSRVPFGSASSMAFEIANQNLTPVTNVEYTCEIAKLVTASGAPIHEPRVLSRGNFRKIAGRRGVTGRCQTGYLITAPLRTAEYQLTVTYRVYPWPQPFTRTARLSAEINGTGEVIGWKVE